MVMRKYGKSVRKKTLDSTLQNLLMANPANRDYHF